MKIITNHHWHNFLYRCQLTEKEKSDLDYAGEDDSYLRYRGSVYALCDFEKSNVEGWDGQHCDLFFSAVLIKLSEDGEQYQMGLYLC